MYNVLPYGSNLSHIKYAVWSHLKGLHIFFCYLCAFICLLCRRVFDHLDTCMCRPLAW